MSIVLGILTFILIVVSLCLVLVVLAQPAKSDGGMGATLGGGMAESTFGGETGNVLTKATINLAIAFFILTLVLFLGNIYQRHHAAAATAGALPTIAMPMAKPAATPAAKSAPPAPAATPAPKQP